LRWRDLDVEQKTLRIERAVEQISEYGLAIKEPKTARGRGCVIGTRKFFYDDGIDWRNREDFSCSDDPRAP
jgi:hypothetical protein